MEGESDMRSKTLRNALIIGMVFITLGGTTTIKPSQTYAESNSMQEKTIGITNVNQVLEKIGNYYYQRNLSLTWYEAPNSIGVKHNFQLRKNSDSISSEIDLSISGEEIESLYYDSTIPKFLGENVFENNTDQEQSYNTSKFSETYTESTSTSVSKGFKINVGRDFTIPLILNEGGKINLEYNSGSTNTNTLSKTYTLEVPSQPVKVPPNKIYKAVVEYSQRTYKGTVKFYGRNTHNPYPINTIKTTGSYTGWMGMQEIKQFTFNDPLYKHYDGLSDSQKKEVENDGVVIIPFLGATFVVVEGKGSFEGVYGAKLNVKTYDITDKNNIKLVDSRSIDL